VIPAERYKATEVTTLPYPAFPTDVQSPIMALMAVAEGTSILTERIYPDRFMTAAELRRMGANISVANGQAVIQGVPKLKPAPIMASDLRAGAALTIAALAAEGETRLSRVYHIDRGYERFEERLRKLGASIQRVVDEAPDTAKEAAAGA
jgi:UDP-N-acetylglucosamine 1-carboxyvinyltransferase